MKKLVTNMDQHGRVLIPSEIRERLNIQPGDKVNLEVYGNELKIISANQIIDVMHTIFTKNQNSTTINAAIYSSSTTRTTTSDSNNSNNMQ